MDLEIRGAGDLLGEKQSGNIRRVGFELYCRMLEEAAATLRGEPYAPDIEPEIKMGVTAYLPEDYIEDAGLRLSFYKRMAAARSEDEVWAVTEEIEDRFGPLPQEAVALRELMAVKVMLRHLGAYGIEAGPRRVQVHLSDRTPISPQALLRFVQAKTTEKRRLTPEMKLAVAVQEDANPIALARRVLDELTELVGSSGV
jgi:transcription-repair coupling factor (superfamily II helicase)